MIIEDLNQLRSLYGKPSERAINKESNKLDHHAINYIKKSPFLILSTVGKNQKMDSSPRG